MQRRGSRYKFFSSMRPDAFDHLTPKKKKVVDTRSQATFKWQTFFFFLNHVYNKEETTLEIHKVTVLQNNIKIPYISSLKKIFSSQKLNKHMTT